MGFSRKLILLLIFYILVSVFPLKGQDCGAQLSLAEEQTMSQLKALKPSDRTASLNFAIQFHAVQNNSGVVTFSAPQADQYLAELNRNFADAGVSFYQCGPMDVIPDPALYHYNHSPSLIRTYNVPKAFNVYVVETVKLNGMSYGGLASYPTQEPFAVIKDNIPVLIHEIGHNFGLYHTHGKSNEEKTDELVNGSNCESAGDELCDTPADPKLTGLVNSDCEYVGGARDLLGTLYQPDPSNFMSYAHRSCLNSFSPQQFDKIRSTAQNFYSFMLEGPSPLPDVAVTSLTAEPQIYVQGRTFEIEYDLVKKGCDFVRNGAGISFFLSENGLLDSLDRFLYTRPVPTLNSGWYFYHGNASLKIPEDLPDGQYTLLAEFDSQNKVEETSETNNQASFKLTVFRRGKILSGNIFVHPNPSSGVFTINLSDMELGTSLFQIFDESGRLVKEIQFYKQQEQEHHRVDVSDLAAGMYFLRATGETMNMVTRVVVLPH